MGYAHVRNLFQDQRIADEWVTATRLEHVLQKLPLATGAIGIEHTGQIIRAMIEDVLREAEGEIVVTEQVKTAIGKKVAAMWKRQLQSKLEGKD